MNLPALTLWFEAGVAILLVVTIVFAIRLNTRISGLRERDSELQEMIIRFDEASSRAHDSAAVLKSAGEDAERELRAAIERAQAMRDELAFMVEHGGRIADRLDQAASRPAPRTEPVAPSSEPAAERPVPHGDGVDEGRQYRSEIEQALAQVIRSTATVG